MNALQYYFNKIPKHELFWVIYVNEEGVIQVEKMELSQIRKEDMELFKSKKIKQVMRKISQDNLSEIIKKKKLNEKFIINFLTSMEKGGIKNEKTGEYNFNVPLIINNVMKQNIQDFEFYLYVSIELKKARPLYDILSEFKIFEEYIDFFKAIESLPDKKKPEVFSLLKEKLYKTKEIKGKLINPTIQPAVMLGIAVAIIVGFANGVYPQMLKVFYLEGREDLIPDVVSLLYGTGTFIVKNFPTLILMLGFFVATGLALMQFEFFKNMFIRQLLQLKLYNLYNEFFLGYIIKLYAASSDKKPFLYTIIDLKRSYDNNMYYYFIFDLIERYLRKGTENVPIAQYGYVFTQSFVENLTQIVKNKDLSLVINYLDTAEEDINHETGKIAKITTLAGTITVAVVVMGLMLSFQQITGATQQLLAS